MSTYLDSSTAFSILVWLGITPKRSAPAQPYPAQHAQDLHSSKRRGGERSGHSLVLLTAGAPLSPPFTHTSFLPTKIIDHCYLFWIHRGPSSPGDNTEGRQFGCWLLLLCAQRTGWLGAGRGARRDPEREFSQGLHCPSSKTLDSITSGMPVSWKI